MAGIESESELDVLLLGTILSSSNRNPIPVESELESVPKCRRWELD